MAPARTGFRKRITLGTAALILFAAGATAAVASTRAKAQEVLNAVAADAEAAGVARVQLTKAQDALDRAAAARQAGNVTQADLLDALALEWASTAADLVRVAQLEARADATEKETAELEAQAKRALTLIEQTVARRGKAAQQLKELGVEVDPSLLALPTNEKPSTTPGAAPSPNAASDQGTVDSAATEATP